MNFIQRRQHIWVPEVIACQNGIILQHGNNLGDIPLNFRGVMGYIAKHEFKKILIIFKIKKIATPNVHIIKQGTVIQVFLQRLDCSTRSGQVTQVQVFAFLAALIQVYIKEIFEFFPVLKMIIDRYKFSCHP